ncbi:uncharacterized protein LOC133525221 [Cydia pomonella]|uniref:uncharacterized protein LOC133525221 n=1 Tax=Cydia pomonella TaxID=82600 RepID=UPI002ADE8446|nr:uncharacterized protein LOC133525221 [Cydia pomonella]
MALVPVMLEMYLEISMESRLASLFLISSCIPLSLAPSHYKQIALRLRLEQGVEQCVSARDRRLRVRLRARRAPRQQRVPSRADVHGKIQRPCQSYDTFCIRKFFAQHSQCKISGRQVPEPLFRAQTTLNIPNTNVSATFNNMEYRGIKDGRVAEFYVDKATDNLVIAVDFNQVTFGSQTLYLKYYLRGREPVVVEDAAGATFVQVSVTAVIPDLKDLKLDRAEIFTYNGDPVPPFLAGPRLALSTDPEVVTMFAGTVANVPTDAQESLMTEGVFYILNFIQYNICDFGLKVI